MWYHFCLLEMNINIAEVQAKEKAYRDAKLCDICIGTSAAPTFLPAHYFETIDEDGNPTTYDLIDGGVAANNPVRERLLFMI